MTENNKSKLQAHVRLCIALGRHTTEAAFLIEQDSDFKTAYTMAITELTGRVDDAPHRACMPVEHPEGSPHLAPNDFHKHPLEGKWIKAINLALQELRNGGFPTLEVSADLGDGGWRSPNPETAEWEKFRTYDLCIKYSQSGKCFPATLHRAVQLCRKELGADLVPIVSKRHDIPTGQVEEALSLLAGHRIMAVLTVVEREPLKPRAPVEKQALLPL